jgi:malonyl-CoA/methylmalonyl-CoA synthetase
VSGIEIIRRAETFGDSPALLSGGDARPYSDLLRSSAAIATALLDGASDLAEQRVAFLIPGSFEYAATLWGVWRAGGVAVPLSVSATEPEIEYVLADARVGAAVAPQRLADKIAPLCLRLGLRSLRVEDAVGVEPSSLPQVAGERRAMILYTSGTTSKPKGVVTTHANIEAQIRSLVEAWGWRADDRIPLFLPLHHVHGIVNVLSCALWSGALVETFERFDIEAILARVAERAYTLFMAVPTIYVRLVDALESATPEARRGYAAGFASMRLMVSGSAALPASIHETWSRLTGQKLLERYGMTEIGMGISNPLIGERKPGAVGQPLPGVQVRLSTEAGDVIAGEGEPGEIQIRGPGVFSEYWDRPEATRESFVEGWFKTGDVAVLEDGYYRILGRLSVDIIKSGGYKLSALEIEEALRRHPAIKECSVVGVPDETWGEAVAAAVVTREGASLDRDALRAWAGERLSTYKIPKRLKVVRDLPRNSMGKVMKPAVKDLFSASPTKRQTET